MHLEVLPTRNSGAAENMAIDFLLLQRYPEAGEVRFRHYGWHRPSFTFGYSQKIEFVRSQLPVEGSVERCRRPTGGGVVDHRLDWTYALVIPRAHPAYDARAIESYHTVHLCLATTLQELGQNAVLKERCEPSTSETDCAPGVCFNRAELYDVVNGENGIKIAGAAQKRNKHGLLFQGSVSRATVDANLDWDAFHHGFTTKLASALEVTAREHPWPELSEDELSQLVEHYTSPEWNEFR